MDFAFSVFAWSLLLIFVVGVTFWLVEMLLVGRARRGPIEHERSTIEVRIMTIGSQEVVQATVNSLPDGLAGVRVIAEREIDIDGAAVHVVPEAFSCDATRKGRALEWARRTVPCDGTYVLYLDEDTLLRDFHGLPDADIVQLSEQPIRSRSWLTYFAEMFRMGFQLEMAVFPKFRYPLYAWGGGFAVKKSVEDEVTWDAASLTEDTNFLWRAFDDPNRDLAYLPIRAMNQAPPTVREMVHQRRRWVSGAAADSHLLPLRYRLISLFRNAAWALVVLSPLLLVPTLTSVQVAFAPTLFQYLVVGLLAMLLGWASLGYWYYGERVRVLAAVLCSVPVVAIAHSAGAFWAILQPTTDFRVTEKVPPAEIADERLEEIDIEQPPEPADGIDRPAEATDETATAEAVAPTEQ